MADLSKMIGGLIAEVKKHWNEPQKGNYVPYKEIKDIGLAGFGVHWTSTLASTIGLDASNFLVGACIGLKPMDLYWMLLICNIIGIPLSFFKSWYYDNHNMKGGKFIPFLFKTAFPIVFLSTIFVWLPFEKFGYLTKAVVTWIFFFILQFLNGIYGEAFGYWQQIITPNAQERAKVMSITQIIYSLAPTLSGFIIPTVAGLTFGLNDIRTYRTIYPFFSFFGLIINTIMFKRVKERLILPKKGLEYVRIVDALREVAKNKYFWILNSAGWIGFLEGAYGVILSWSFVYAFEGKYAAKLGLANTIIGNAALWSMALAPLVIKKLGKRNLLIAHNLLNVVVFIALYFSFENILAVCVIMFVNNFINVFGNIYFPSMNADIRDYHQWKTGVRVDGLFGPLGVIGTVIGFFTGMVLPKIYEIKGLSEGDYDVLYDDAVRNGLFKTLIICSIIGSILNVIPYLFYDLTETKHKGYVNVLKVRAMFEDYGNNELDNEELIEVMDIITEARNSTRTSDDIKIVLDELDKFNTERYKKKLESSREIYELCAGYEYSIGEAKLKLKEARALSKKTKEEREIRSDRIAQMRGILVAARLIEKHGLNVPDEAVENEIKNREVSTMNETLKQKQDYKAYLKAVSIYRRATAPYNEAKRLIVQAENYTQLSALEKLYEKAKAAI